jgi:glycosyltransferase involved in cell wall biosynthesis
MTILFLTPEFPHAKLGPSGGIGTSIKNLAESLTGLGVGVRILIYGQKADAVWEENGIVFETLQNIKFKGLSWYLTRKKIEKRINQLYSEKKVDLVEAPDWTGITSFIQPNCPIFIRMNGSDTYFCQLDGRQVKFWNRFHEKRALKKANGLLSVSQFTADVTKELFQLKKEITIIPNGIAIDAFKSNQTNPQSNNVILYFGTLIRKKGVLELPLIFNEVIKSNPKAELRLIGKDSADIFTGSASTWELMKPLFSKEALKQTTYSGGMPYDQMRNQIDLASVCVFPTFAEALPVSWLEAMAMKKAIVASNIGWAKEMIDNGVEGYLVHPKQHYEYALKIVELLNNPEKASIFGNNAFKKVVSSFESKIVAQKAIDFYLKILHERT